MRSPWEFTTKYSNLIWATGYDSGNSETQTYHQLAPEQSVNNNININEGHNWSVARERFYLALTSTVPEAREMHLAETFETLGYILHLLEDMAVPAYIYTSKRTHS